MNGGMRHVRQWIYLLIGPARAGAVVKNLAYPVDLGTQDIDEEDRDGKGQDDSESHQEQAHH